jgi:hypothetical protein
MGQAWGCEGGVGVGSVRVVAAALLARKTKKETAPAKTVPMNPIKVKMLALRLRAMDESDWPKQAEQARAVVSETRTNATPEKMRMPSRFIGS